MRRALQDMSDLHEQFEDSVSLNEHVKLRRHARKLQSELALAKEKAAARDADANDAFGGRHSQVIKKSSKREAPNEDSDGEELVRESMFCEDCGMKINIDRKRPTPAQQEYYIGVGKDPVIPAYLRYEGKVKNLCLSEKTIRKTINEVWCAKLEEEDQEMELQEFVVKYMEERFGTVEERMSWSYNLFAGVQRQVEEPPVHLFWSCARGVLPLSHYLSLRGLFDGLRRALSERPTARLSAYEFERAARAFFPQKDEAELRELSEAARRQLSLRDGTEDEEWELARLFEEGPEGFLYNRLGAELQRQRRASQRRLVAQLGHALGAHYVTADALRRALATIDPYIDHVSMERCLRWVFSRKRGPLTPMGPLPRKSVMSRLASADLERMGRSTYTVKRAKAALLF